jgi:hypothetical protein
MHRAIKSRPHLLCDAPSIYAFDILVSDGQDLRRLPLSMRKTNLARLLARRVNRIFLSDFEQVRSVPIYSATPASWGWRAWCQSIARALIAAAGSGTGSRSRTGSIPRSAGFRIVLEQRRHWRMGRFEVPEDNGFIAECVRLWDCGLDTKDIMLIVFQPEHIVENGDHTRSRASLTIEDISHASWDDAEEKDKP